MNKRKSYIKGIHIEMRKGNETIPLENNFLSLFTKIDFKERCGVNAFPQINENQLKSLEKYFMTSEFLILFSIKEIDINIDVNDIQVLYSLIQNGIELLRMIFNKDKRKESDEKENDIVIEDENQEFLGLAIFVFYKDMALLDYFAIAKEQRGSGVGTKALKYLQTYYEGKRFLLEIEDAKIECDNTEERIHRRAFYLRNGMQVMPFKVDLFGVVMEVLTYKAGLLPEEYMRLYTEVFTNKVAENVKIV